VKNGIQKVCHHCFSLSINFLFFSYIIESKTNRSADGTQDINASSILPSSATSSPAMSTPPSGSIQYAVFCSSKEARVYLIDFLINLKI